MPGPLKIGFSLAVKRDPMFEKLGMLLGVQSDMYVHFTPEVQIQLGRQTYPEEHEANQQVDG